MFEIFKSYVAADGGIDREVKFRMNEVVKVCGGMKKSVNM